LAKFCKDYHLTEKIRQPLEALGFETAGALFMVDENVLVEGGLKGGQIAEIRRALTELMSK
jgi:hypothetical protein